jgi:segregation and condensation protein B
LRRTGNDVHLSPAARETLAIVAYRQPIMRADIELIRGVQCGELLRLLMEKGLVRIAGRHDSLGRPVLYGTTKKFLQVFGLKGLQDLPEVEQLRPPEKESRSGAKQGT